MPVQGSCYCSNRDKRMARIDSRLLFLTTSPRSPEKMWPEIELLLRHFGGRPWNAATQRAFMDVLRDEQFFNGRGEKDPAFSARDRINRAPKSLGLVVLTPDISLTPAGKVLLSSKRKEETFLRQLLKFQLPSPFHRPTARAANFCVKPYLEILRLIRTMGTLKFDELQIFGMQLTDWHLFDSIVRKIEAFRMARTSFYGNYRRFKHDYLYKELEQVFAGRIAQGQTHTRESRDTSLDKFLRTQASNMRDYADACFRYLRATGLVNVSHVGKSLSIVPERCEDVDFILRTVDREPCFVDDEQRYVSYLGDAALPKLLTDDPGSLIKKLRMEFPSAVFDEEMPIDALKDFLADLMEKRKVGKLLQEVREIKSYKLYDDIQGTFEQIKRGELYDAPLMLEWNTWRAMTMLDGGDIKANLKFDDFGTPIAPAQGNRPDILCDYGDFLLSVEVTLASGQRQYETESEPVSRHLGRIKNACGKPCFCLFIAPTINDACVAHFYALHQMNISYYGGKSVIVPLPLDVFQAMLEESYKAERKPTPERVRSFLESSEALVKESEDERQWYAGIQKLAKEWLSSYNTPRP